MEANLVKREREREKKCSQWSVLTRVTTIALVDSAIFDHNLNRWRKCVKQPCRVRGRAATTHKHVQN